MKILLAEDDTNISIIARMALEKLGNHQVVLATDGELALNTALSQRFDLILLDEMMPKMSGIVVCREYKSRQVNAAPVIFLSAKSQESDIAEFHEAGLGYIAKPFDPTLLCGAIEKILSNHGVKPK